MENMVTKNQHVLITGGLGNLGSWLTNHFCTQGYDVTVLTHRQRQLNIDNDYKLIFCDIQDVKEIKEKVDPDKYDIIIHAASVNDGFAPDYFRSSLLINTLGTRNLLEVLKEKFNGHFIYFSTFQVYGKYSGEITETFSPHPKNDYGSTHLFAEFYLSQFGKIYNFPYSTVRLTNSYGCPKDINSSKWYLILNDLSKTAFETQKIILKSNGKAVRDFIWMQEVCEIIEKLSIHPPTREIFNLSGQKTFSMLDIAHFVKKAYQKIFDKIIEITVNQEDKTEPKQLLVKSDKIRDLLSYHNYQEQFEEESKNIFYFLQKYK